MKFGNEIDLKKELPKLQKQGLRICNSDDLFSLKSKQKESINQIFETLMTCDNYLKDFLPPEHKNCIACGTSLGGILGSFQYDLIHGEGHCSNCGYPARANHYIKDTNGKEIMNLNLILQYHPLGLLFDKKEDDEKEG